jgi:hypothetical protein
MVIHDDGFKTCLFARPAEAPGVGKLKSDQEVVARAEPQAMRLYHFGAQRSEGRRGARIQNQLMGVSTRLGQHGHGLTAPNQLGTASPEA